MSTVIKFLLATFISFAAIFIAGWTTSLSMVMYAASLSLFTFAFFPFLLIIVGIALPFVGLTLFLLSIFAAVIAPLGGGIPANTVDPESLVDGALHGAKVARFGSRMFDTYYRWLARTRHPLLWGTVVGTFLGAVSLWGLITWLVLPGEARTAEILVTTRDAVILQFKEMQQMPPVRDGHLLFRDIGIDLPGPVVDGFGQPLDFTIREPSFRLHSNGFDRRPGSDDMCTTGEVELSALQKLKRWTKIAAKVASTLEFKLVDGKVKINGKLNLRDAAKQITELRCGEK